MRKTTVSPNFFGLNPVKHGEFRIIMPKEVAQEEQRNNRRLLIWFLIALSIAIIPWIVTGAIL